MEVLYDMLVQLHRFLNYMAMCIMCGAVVMDEMTVKR